MPKRVLVFSTDDHLYPAGGAEQAFGNIAERLPHIEFDLICGKLRKGVTSFEKVGNINIYRMGFGIPRVDGYILALFGHRLARKLMQTRTYDLVWSIMASYGAFAAVRVKKRTQVPFLLTLQEGDPFEYIYGKVKHVRKRFDEIFKSADGLQAISSYLLAWGKHMGFCGKYSAVIPNGVAIEAFTQDFDEALRRNTRESFALPKDAFVLMTSSRLEKKNGIGDVIEALSHLPEHVCFVICGSGSLEGKLRARVTELNLEGRVCFKGFVDPKDLPLIMKSSDAFIRPSLSEGLGNAFLEAYAAELPIIATSVGGIADFLIDGETGFSVEPENPKSIAEGILRVINLSPKQREELTHRTKELVAKRYSWDLIARDMEEKLFTPISREK